MAHKYSLYQQAPRLSQQTHSSVFDLRKVLETSQSNQQAVRYLSKQSYSYDLSVLMTDKKNIQVLEYPRGGVAKIRRWNSPTRTNKRWGKPQQIAMIGCHVLASLPENCRDAKEGYHWARLRQLAVFNPSNPSNPANIHDMVEILLDQKNHLFEIFNTRTLQSMVYQPKTSNLYLYTASIDGTLSQSPTHHPYLNLIPDELRHQTSNKNKHLPLWLITALLFAIVFWVGWKDRNSH